MAGEDVAGFAGRDHEPGFAGILEIVKAAKPAADRAGERQVRRSAGAAAAIEGVEPAARGEAEIAQAVKQRNMGIDLVA